MGTITSFITGRWPTLFLPRLLWSTQHALTNRCFQKTPIPPTKNQNLSRYDLLRITPPKINSLPLKNDGSKSTFLLVPVPFKGARSLLKGRTVKFQGCIMVVSNKSLVFFSRFPGLKTKLQPYSFGSIKHHQPNEAPNDADGVPEGLFFLWWILGGAIPGFVSAY